MRTSARQTAVQMDSDDRSLQTRLAIFSTNRDGISLDHHASFGKKMSRVSAAIARYDLIDELEISPPQWETIDKNGKIVSSPSQRESAILHLVKFANAAHAFADMPTMKQVEDPLTALGNAARKLATELNRLESPEQRDFNLARRNREPTDQQMIDRSSIASLTAHDYFREAWRKIAKTGIVPAGNLPLKGNVPDLHAWIERLYSDIGLSEQSARLAVEDLRDEFGDSSATAHQPVQALLIALAAIYREAGGNVTAHKDISLFTRWVFALTEFLPEHVRKSEVALSEAISKLPK